MNEGAIDSQKAEALAFKLVGDLNSAMSLFNVYLGHKLGLYRVMAEIGPATSAELAKKSGCAERMLREWLAAQTAAGYISHDAQAGKFSLSPEQAAVLTEPDSPFYVIAMAQFGPSLAGVLPQLMDAFRNGGGVPYHAYGQDCIEAIAYGNRPMYINDLASKWIPAMPDVAERLRSGGRVADVGCGVGWSAICLAKGYPNARVDGVDLDAASVEQARAAAAREGLADRVTFHQATAEDSLLRGPYDLVMAFECLHDMPYPVAALRKIRELASPGGIVLLADEAAGDTLEENCNFLGQLFYNFSVLHCLPQALVFPDAAGTGTAIGAATVRSYAQEAGFSKVETLDIENPFFRFYRMTP